MVNVSDDNIVGPPRVLMVRKGGWETWVDTVARYLSGQGFAVSAVLLNSGSEEKETVLSDGPVRLVEYQVGRSRFGKGVDFCRMGRRLRRSLNQEDFDVLYAVDSWTLFPLWVATGGRFRWRGRPLVYHTFEWLEPGVHRNVHIRLERKACRTADLVVNIDRMKGRLQQTLYRLPRCPLWVRNSLALAYPLPPADPARRREMTGAGAPPDALVVINPSTASAERQTLELIQSLSYLPERFRFTTIAGEGAYFRQCQEAVASLGLQGRVVFLPRMPFDRLMEYVASADLGTIFQDGRFSSGNFMANPIRLSQFTACGLPFVACDSPTLAGDVYRYGLGLCCDGLDPKAIASALRELAEGNPPLAGRKQHVRRMFETQLCFESRGGELVEALRELAVGTVVAAGNVPARLRPEKVSV